jgi:hypothetical protein
MGLFKNSVIAGLVAISAAASLLNAQNLVPNPSFESVVTPPCSWLTAANQLPGCVTNWTMPSDGSSDIFSNYVATSCYAHNFSTNASAPGQQAPRTGNVQAAILTYGAGCGSVPNYREYLQVQLTSPMTSGLMYDFSFYLSMADYNSRASNNFGVVFRVGSYYQATCFVLPLTPQFNSTAIVSDKIGWVQISGSITATANWSHIIIGNFFSNAATTTIAAGGAQGNSRYYIDDVSVQVAVVTPAQGLFLEGERAENGAVQLDWMGMDAADATDFVLQRSQWGDVWENVADLDPLQTQYNDNFAPNTRLLYRLRYRDANGEAHSSDQVEVQAVEGKFCRAYIAGNPVRQGENAILRLANADEREGQVQLMDMAGRLIWRSETAPVQSFDNLKLPVELLKAGSYFVSITSDKKVASAKLVVLE